MESLRRGGSREWNDQVLERALGLFWGECLKDGQIRRKNC